MFSGKGALASKQSEKKRKNLIKNIFLSLFIFVGIASGLYSAPRYEEITIKNVSVFGNEVLEREKIENLVWDDLSGKKYFIFPNRNIFLYPKEKIEESIKSLSPYVLTASVGFKDFNSVSVEVVERKPYALYCGAQYESSEDQKCYFLDDKGFMFDEAPQFSGNTFVKYFGTTTEPYVGNNYLNTILFQTLTRFVDGMKKENLNTKSVYVISPEEIYLYLDTESKIIISEKSDYAKVIDYINEIMTSPEFKGKDEEGKLNVSYIDFRFGNKIFYKK